MANKSGAPSTPPEDVYASRVGRRPIHKLQSAVQHRASRWGPPQEYLPWGVAQEEITPADCE
eukprot:1588263-Pyramimonas_sp.AAC.1